MLRISYSVQDSPSRQKIKVKKHFNLYHSSAVLGCGEYRDAKKAESEPLSQGHSPTYWHEKCSGKKAALNYFKISMASNFT